MSSRNRAPSLIGAVEKAAAAAAESAMRSFVSSLGPVAAVGVVGGNRRLPELPQISVTTIPATGMLLSEASHVLGVALEPALAALGKSIGPPWQKNYKEATAAALVALEALG